MTPPNDPAAPDGAGTDGRREEAKERGTTENDGATEKRAKGDRPTGADRGTGADRRPSADRQATANRGTKADRRATASGRTGGDRRETATGTDDGRSERGGREPPRTDQLSLPMETLAVLNWLGDRGLDGAQSRLNTVLDDDITVRTEQVTVDYAEQGTVGLQFDAEEVAGARVLLRKPLVGNVLVVFPMDSANKAAALMLQRAVEDLSSVSTEMGRDALTELCNMMANAFVDEWATLFETTIDTGSPVAVQAPVRTLVRRILTQYELGLHITSRLAIPEYDVEGAVYVFPGKAEFVRKLSRVGLEVIER